MMSLTLPPLRTYCPISGLVGRPAHYTQSRARDGAHETRLPGRRTLHPGVHTGDQATKDLITFADEPELATVDSFFPGDYLDRDVLPTGDREVTLDEFKVKHEAAIALLRLQLSFFLVFNTKFAADLTYKSYAELPEDEVVRLLVELSPGEQ